MQPASQPERFFSFFFFFCFSVFVRAASNEWLVCTPYICTYIRRKYNMYDVRTYALFSCSVILYAAEIGFVGKKNKKGFLKKEKVPQAPVYLNDLRLRERERGEKCKGKVVASLVLYVHMDTKY